MKKETKSTRTKIELFFIMFALHVYTNYIVEDWSHITKIGKIYYYPFWFIRSVIVWIVCPIFLPEYFFKKSKLYKEIQKITNSKEFQMKLSSFQSFQ